MTECIEEDKFCMNTFKKDIDAMRYKLREEKETLKELLDMGHYIINEIDKKIIITKDKNCMKRIWTYHYACVKCGKRDNDIEYPMCYKCFCAWENYRIMMRDNDDDFLPDTDDEN